MQYASELSGRLGQKGFGKVYALAGAELCKQLTIRFAMTWEQLLEQLLEQLFEQLGQLEQLEQLEQLAEGGGAELSDVCVKQDSAG